MTIANESGLLLPLDSPGMPEPGAYFTALAHCLAGEDADADTVNSQLYRLYRRALYGPPVHLPITEKGRTYTAPVLPGHLWGSDTYGPEYAASRGCRVVIVGKAPGQEEAVQHRNFCGPSGQALAEGFSRVGIPPEEYLQFYVTNVCRWPVPPRQSGALPRRWVKDCDILLEQELRIIRPDVVLCLGAEAVRAVLNRTLRDSVAQVFTREVPTPDGGVHRIKVVTATHPAAVLRKTEKQAEFLSHLKSFAAVLGGSAPAKPHSDVKLYYIRKLEDLRAVTSAILSQPGLKKIAVDAEWHGRAPTDGGSYLRTVQFSPHPDVGFVVILTGTGGMPVFEPGLDAAMQELRRLLDRDDVQIGGSFFSADLPWLDHFGCPLGHRFRVPPDIDKVRGGNYAGGMDVALACHALDETGEFKLELMANRYCGVPRWDNELLVWKKAYCSEHGLKDEELEGYGMCPDEILYPYSGYDAVYTRRLMDIFAEKLHADVYGNDCWQPFMVSMLAFPAFLEMGQVGVRVDRQRVDDLTADFMAARERKLQELRQAANWPDFNPRSAYHCRQLLFGTRYSGKKDEEGRPVRVSPRSAISLDLQPVKTTEKPARDWERVLRDGDEEFVTPGTDKEVLGILGAQHPVALLLRDVRFVDQVLKSVLRVPETDADGNVLRTADGFQVYPGGITRYICDDGRVRSRFTQVKETGRASSAHPPLQNLSKRREADYARILGDGYRWPLRSILVADPDGAFGEPTVLLESDYSGAELVVQAILSRDENMISHCLDPDYDIHSHVAVEAFRLECEPSKAGLASINKTHMRVAAKNVIFGIGYGRAAPALVRQCKEEGLDISIEEAQQLIDAIFQRYPRLAELQDACRRRVLQPGWIRNAFGRLRRFVGSNDRSVLGALERQAMNFPIQSFVADAVSWALYFLESHPERERLGYKIILQLHDAIILEVPIRSILEVHDRIIPECMVEKVSFRACNLDGVPYTDSPEYRFTVEKDVMLRFGQKLTEEDCLRYQIPSVLAG